MDQNDRSYRVAGEGKSPAAIVDRGARFVAPACSACRLLSFASWYPPWPPLCFVVVLVLHMDSATHSGASLAAPWCRAPCSVLACGRQSSAQPMLLWLCVRHEALLQRVVPSLTPRYRRHYCIYAIAHGCVIVSVRFPCTCAHRHRTDLGGAAEHRERVFGESYCRGTGRFKLLRCWYLGALLGAACAHCASTQRLGPRMVRR